MVYLSSEAVRTRSRVIDIGGSMRNFLLKLGMPTSGGPRGGYTMLRQQVEALAACRLKIGMQASGRVTTVDTTPIRSFDAWLRRDGSHAALRPAMLELTQEFYETLIEHAVPVDPRALAALRHSALALDVYTWLAHRLCRISSPQGVRLSWQNLRDQFGQEYGDQRNFKRMFRIALRQVLVVYSAGRVERLMGGLVLYPSPPPLAPTSSCGQLDGRPKLSTMHHYPLHAESPPPLAR
jgi:hypothetical protein